ncbi:MAG: hypothetical protein LBN92_06680 [Treponema sp.]|nr:hypothetical protein [Treponema sp.]
MKRTLFGTFFVLAALSPALFGADITVPRLEWFSRGSMVNDELVIASAAEAELAVNGGYKYGITLGLGLEVPNMERAVSHGRLNLQHAASGSPPDAGEYNKLVDEVNDRFNNQATLSFRMLEATARELFGKPLDFSFFTGTYDSLASGDDFAPNFGTAPVGTDLRGFFYYADGLRVLDPRAPLPPSVVPEQDPGIRFNGAIHTITGTGGKITYTPADRIITSFYIYQDLSFRDSGTGAARTGHYSGDLSLLANFEHIKLEAFAGSTYSNDRETKEETVFRGGLLACFSSGAGTELLIQAGVPYWRKGGDFAIDNCYFLLEPRFRFGIAGLTLTFFYRPSYYNNRMIVDEDGKREHGLADINAKLFFGSLETSAVQGGIEGTVELGIRENEDIKMWISPFLSAVSSGLLWDFKVRINPRYFTSGESTAAEGYIGIRTSF